MFALPFFTYGIAKRFLVTNKEKTGHREHMAAEPQPKLTQQRPKSFRKWNTDNTDVADCTDKLALIDFEKNETQKKI
jgi:hypothetical protein